MADLHPEVLALIEAGRQFVDGNLVELSDGRKLVSRRAETCEEFARRIALRQQELEREDCAKVCEARATYWRESVAEGTEVDGYESQLLDETATIIRQRGKP